MSVKTKLTKLRRHFLRRGQTGQSIIVLAIGFLALLGFVGIVTDVSLLFVRYSTLRRAVDAAAVAAAGQMRRVPSATEGEGQGTSVANLNLAARQFIEVYGLDPSNVVVETCYAQLVGMKPIVAGGVTSYRPIDDAGIELYTYASGAPNAPKTGDNPAADAAVRERYEELCKENELKLVRVTAQVDSPTVFLRLLGFSTITLTESSISQTAVLDVVLILDVSESMAYETTYDDWETVPDDPANGFEGPYYYRYAPPYVGINDWDRWEQDLIPNNMANLLNPAVFPNSYSILTYSAGDTLPPATHLELDGSVKPGRTIEFLPPGVSSSERPQNPLCSVRVSPQSSFAIGSTFPAWLRQEYVDVLGSSWVNQRYGTDTNFRGFVPMYRSYACCNDPNGDFDFVDLVCQPFQRVRDATSEFLNNLDFIRGDRVAFVTFDTSAHVIDPDGAGGQRTMIETETNLDTNGDGVIDPALNERRGAQDVLESLAGVRAEPNYYLDGDDGIADDDGSWDALREFDNAACDPANPDTCWVPRDYNYFLTTPIGEIFVQPSVSSCFLERAILNEPQVPSYYHDRINGHATWSLLTDATSLPDWYWDKAAASAEIPVAGDQYWESQYAARNPATRSPEYRGGCGGGNIGGALGQAQQALIDGGRTEGAVWLMVLLSDGAAGVSDPILRETGDPANPTDLQNPNVYQYLGAYWGPQQGDYGAFGVCPYGTDGSPGELLLDDGFPFCSDKAPETRHYCNDLPMPPTQLTTNHPDCDTAFYDADDYAHDWADWVALAELPFDVDRSAVQRQGSEQLPTIFTIGIGLDFNPIDPDTGIRACDDNDWDCRIALDHTYEDRLGEQLLRYIADVGDNNRVDDDYWQCELEDRLPVTSQVIQVIAGVTDCGNKVDPDWGPRGPCEVPSSDPNVRGIYDPIQPQQSCGNYFAAGTPEELERVFSVIASRMFTRLSQ